MTMTSIYDWNLAQLQDIVENLGFKKYNGEQILRWLYQSRVDSFDEMSNLSLLLRETLKKSFQMQLPKILQKQKSSDGTIKFLLELEDQRCVETVIMRYVYGNAVCVSSQVGCNMGCSFCESGRLKKVRNLETFEMVSQILQIEKDLNMRISSVVIMGIGEPLDNYDNVIRFIKIINDPKALAIGIRHITLSTSGLVPKIYDLMDLDLQINLAISLHAPNDEIRSKIMKVNKVYNISQLLTAIKDYIARTNRRVTIEYVMLKVVNDSKECAKELANLLHGLNIYVNLIPYNETNHLEYQKSSPESISEFCKVLKDNKINVTVRKEFGGKISAACGQLRSKEVKE